MQKGSNSAKENWRVKKKFKKNWNYYIIFKNLEGQRGQVRIKVFLVISGVGSEEWRGRGKEKRIRSTDFKFFFLFYNNYKIGAMRIRKSYQNVY